MKVNGIIEEDFVNYRKPSLFIGFPYCTMKCNKECGKEVCQNQELLNYPHLHITYQEVLDLYTKNPITKAFVFGGMEPFDNWDDLYNLISFIRRNDINDDIVIYSGYYPYEKKEEIEQLSQYKNIIIKFGRFIPDKANRYDGVLGVTLSSDNQYASRIS